MTEYRSLVDNMEVEDVFASVSTEVVTTSSPSILSTPTARSDPRRRHASHKDMLSDTVVSSENIMGEVQALVRNMKAEMGSLKRKIEQLDVMVAKYQKQQQEKDNDGKTNEVPILRELAGTECFMRSLPFIILLGKRYSGVTIAMLQLVHIAIPTFPRVLVFSHDQQWAKIVPAHAFFDGPTSERLDFVLQKLIEAQKVQMRNGTAENVLVVLDGVLTAAASILPSVIYCAKNGRQLKIAVVASAQYFNDFTPVLRQNSDYVFTATERAKMIEQKMYQEWFNALPNFEMFDKVMDKFTTDYRMVVANRTCTSRIVEDNVFWFKSKKCVFDFRAGSEAFWKAEDPFYEVTPEHKRLIVPSLPIFDAAACMTSQRPPFVVVCGARETGKTTAMMHLRRISQETYSRVFAFGVETQWQECASNDCWFADCSSVKIDRELQKVLSDQEETFKNGTQQKVLLIFDSGSLHTGVLQLDSFKRCCVHGSHLQIGVIASVQKQCVMSPILRQNADYVLVRSTNDRSERKRLYQDWFGVFPTLKAFEETLSSVTDNFGFLTAYQRARSNNIQDTISQFRAPPDQPILRPDTSINTSPQSATVQ